MAAYAKLKITDKLAAESSILRRNLKKTGQQISGNLFGLLTVPNWIQ